MRCPRCRVKMVRKPSAYNSGHWWGCPNWPRCTITAAEHPDGTLMSTPADFKTKMMRREAHELCAAIWGDWHSISKSAKQKQYDWLAKNTKTGHIGKLHYNELVKLCQDLRILKKQVTINKSDEKRDQEKV